MEGDNIFGRARWLLFILGGIWMVAVQNLFKTLIVAHGGAVATGHTPTPSHSRTIFRAGGGGWVWGGEGGCQEGGGGFIA